MNSSTHIRIFCLTLVQIPTTSEHCCVTAVSKLENSFIFFYIFTNYSLCPWLQVTNENHILQAIKKKWEFPKADVRLPELNHLPELRGAEGGNFEVL